MQLCFGYSPVFKKGFVDILDMRSGESVVYEEYGDGRKSVLRRDF
jgi:hypothetical protein